MSLFESFQKEKRLGAIGGPDMKTCVLSILNRLMTKDLQASMTLTGKRTDKKGLLDHPDIMDLVHNSVRITFPNYKDKDGEAIIGKYLQKL